MPRIVCRFQARCTQNGTSTDELNLDLQPGWIYCRPFEQEQRRVEAPMGVHPAVPAGQRAAVHLEAQRAAVPPEAQRAAFHLEVQKEEFPPEALVVFAEGLAGVV